MSGSASGFTRIPPHSIEAEESVIGGVLLDNEAFDRIADVVKPEDFYVERHARILGAMAALSDSAMPMDAVTIAERLRQRGDLERIGGVAFLLVDFRGNGRQLRFREMTRGIADELMLHAGIKLQNLQLRKKF